MNRETKAARSLRQCGGRALLLLMLLLAALTADAGELLAACSSAPGVQLRTAPLAPRAGGPLQVMAVAVDGPLEALQVSDPTGRTVRLTASAGGGPPWSLRGEVATPAAGRYRFEALRGGAPVACGEVVVGGGPARRGSGSWDPATQAFFAAWIEQLFDAPVEESLSFPALTPVLRDPRRNFLHDYLRPGEDQKIVSEPDCADLAYYLRGYFAWKLGLPMAIRACSRGTATAPPRCEAAEIDRTFVGTQAEASTFRAVSIRLMNRAHSGCGRTALEADATDFYPVPLKREALWPGTVYADPSGHTLMIVKWIPAHGDQSGLLLAVDAQPDNSVARKRFWEGTFQFTRGPAAGPGFKAYRAPQADGRGGWTVPANRLLTGDGGVPPFSAEQAELSGEEFYARVEQLINPRGLTPEVAYEATLAALMEQLETRVGSVANGEEYLRSHRGEVIAMPRGTALFETTGPWEDFSTPSRDMRLLIAMKVLAGLPERIRRHPELYSLNGASPAAAAARVAALHERRLGERFITYTRSDGSSWKLSLAEIYQRRAGLEVAYNPNDCVERRWGAAPGSPDYPTCRRQAPAGQRQLMEEYRPWFRDTRRPPR